VGWSLLVQLLYPTLSPDHSRRCTSPTRIRAQPVTTLVLVSISDWEDYLPRRGAASYRVHKPLNGFGLGGIRAWGCCISDQDRV